MSRIGGITLLLVLGAVLAACGASEGFPEGPDGRLRVVASFYPLAEAAEAVGGELVTVDNLTPPGVEPHDLELSADDLEALGAADVIVYVSGGFQPAVEDGIAEEDTRLVDALDVVPSLPPPEGEDEVTVDPHVWLDPGRYSILVAMIAENLAAVRPEDAATFRANAAVFEDELASLDGAFAAGLASCDGRTIVTNHAAFGYLADAYGLEQIAVSGLSPEAEPDPARLAELAELVRRLGVTTVFTEELAPPDVAEALADEAGVVTAVLNPLEGLTAEELAAGQDYVSTMLDNLDTLRGALGCA